MIKSVELIGVVGAGTMGAGIAQVACLGGFETRLHDPVPEALTQGIERVGTALAKGAEAGRWSADAATAASSRLSPASRVEDLAGCDLVIEAAPEDLELKRGLFAQLAEACGEDAVLATNTSSLPVAAIASAVPRPERLCGMHFFNPPALMKLVEIVATPDTSKETLEAATDVGRHMGRTPIHAADGPGFLANRLYRPFSLEALRLLGDGVATHEEIDRACRLGGGFRMGPFELMDLIGIDLGFEVAKSFFEQSFYEPRWRPHPIQAQMAMSGRHGRKTGRGYYDYSSGPHRPEDPEIEIERPIADEAKLAEIAGPKAPEILGRIVAQIVNEAAYVLEAGVGTPEDADIAMKLGFNWPLGPIEWSRWFGLDRALAILDEQRHLRGEGYLPSPLLRTRVAEGAESL